MAPVPQVTHCTHCHILFLGICWNSSCSLKNFHTPAFLWAWSLLHPSITDTTLWHAFGWMAMLFFFIPKSFCSRFCLGLCISSSKSVCYIQISSTVFERAPQRNIIKPHLVIIPISTYHVMHTTCISSFILIFYSCWVINFTISFEI